ncbi:MAG TPA: ABC transporter ATP-binding protein [Nocardioidaceae bacterium]|nr:ABC transporter ATP-binding protein [Nocardioidaceae bacterium]
MGEHAIRAEGLARTFPGGGGVHGIGLDVAYGEVHALVGLNGAGKTTLMRLLLGMLRPESGTVAVRVPWSAVGHTVDEPFGYPDLTTIANLTVAARLRGVPKAEVGEVVAAAIADLGLAAYARRRARALSQGNRQRLNLAAALQHRPRVVVLDEPTSALDPRGVILLREALLRRAADGAGVLVSSHHLDEVARVADRITVINHGVVIGWLDPGGRDIERDFFALVLADDESRSEQVS